MPRLDWQTCAAHGAIMIKEIPDMGALEKAMLALIAERGPDRSADPSEAARAVAGDHPDQWGPLMQPVRRIAVSLAKQGRLVITRKGRIVDPDDFKGVYRVSLPRSD